MCDCRYSMENPFEAFKMKRTGHCYQQPKTIEIVRPLRVCQLSTHYSADMIYVRWPNQTNHTLHACSVLSAQCSMYNVHVCVSVFVYVHIRFNFRMRTLTLIV